ncbi:MAG: NAD-dependent deacylase [Bacteroidetes bacterium]|nr:NAD-dependent deacylase [Bacteroidota bacterium]
MRIVVLTGAGISAESGIPTFRGAGGLWEGHRIEDVASPDGWNRNAALVLEFYNLRRRAVLSAQPNKAHIDLAALDAQHDVFIITQNIDDLHERAGSKNILHLHGEILKARSIRNPNLILPINGDILLGDTAPDGAQLRPHIVWFGEEVPMLEKAIPLVESADVLVIIGTSMVVYPAAGLLYYADPHIPVYVINPEIPEISGNKNISYIQQNASAGVEEFIRQFNLN